MPIEKHFAIIVCTNGLGILVDKEDYEFLMQFTWRACCTKRKFYAYAYKEGKDISMHRLLLNLENSNLMADHINGMTLDNRRKNLRIVTAFQNQKNAAVRKHSKTGFKGVSQVGKKFQARIKVQGRRISLGYFNTAEEAGEAFATAAKIHFGEYAYDNRSL